MKMNRHNEFSAAKLRDGTAPLFQKKSITQCVSEEENCCEYFKTHEKHFSSSSCSLDLSRQQRIARETRETETRWQHGAVVVVAPKRKHSASEFSHFHDVRKGSLMRIFERLRRNSVAAVRFGFFYPSHRWREESLNVKGICEASEAPQVKQVKLLQ
jgi:hypothetical protein